MDIELLKKMRKIKCVYSDIDGTIFNSKHELTDKTKKTIRQFIKQRYIFGLISARHWLVSYHLIKKLKINGFYAGLNGAEITNVRRNDNIFKVAIDPKTAKELNLFLIRENFPFVFFTENNLYYFLGHNDVFECQMKLILSRINPIIVPIKMTHYNEFVSRIDQILYISIIDINNTNKIQKLLDAFQNNPHIDFAKTNVTLDIKSSATNKGVALQQLAKLHKLNLEEILVFGNADNDIPMFRKAGVSIALKQAKTDVIQSANSITQFTNDEDGVACFLERYFLS